MPLEHKVLQEHKEPLEPKVLMVLKEPLEPKALKVFKVFKVLQEPKVLMVLKEPLEHKVLQEPKVFRVFKVFRVLMVPLVEPHLIILLILLQLTPIQVKVRFDLTMQIYLLLQPCSSMIPMTMEQTFKRF